MSLNSLKKMAAGGELENDETTTPEAVTSATPATTTPAKKISPLAQQAGNFNANPELAKARDERARAYYEKQIADAKRENEGFGSFTGIDTVLGKYGLSPTGQPNGQNIIATKLAAKKAEQEGIAGLGELDTLKAAQATRGQFDSLMNQARAKEQAGDKAGANALRNQAVSLDPTMYGAQLDARKLETQAVSSHGKQAQDEGLQRGTPEFNARVAQLEQRDFALKKQAADLSLAKLNLAISKDANKPLGATEQKEVNRLTDNFQTASRNVSEGDRLLGTLKGAGIFDTGAGKYANPLYYFGAGKAAEIEAQVSALAPKQRPPGSGATSDYDAKQYKTAVGGSLTPAGMEKAVRAGIAMNKHDADYAMFMATVKENRGSTTQAAKIWQDYANANPIFDVKSGKVIEGRKTFQQWVDEGAPTKAGGTDDKAAVPPAPAAISKGTTKTIGGVTYTFDGTNWTK